MTDFQPINREFSDTSFLQQVDFDPMLWLGAKIRIELLSGTYSDRDKKARDACIPAKNVQVFYTTVTGIFVYPSIDLILLGMAAAYGIILPNTDQLEIESLKINTDMVTPVTLTCSMSGFEGSRYYVKAKLLNLETGQEFHKLKQK